MIAHLAFLGAWMADAHRSLATQSLTDALSQQPHIRLPAMIMLRGTPLFGELSEYRHRLRGTWPEGGVSESASGGQWVRLHPWQAISPAKGPAAAAEVELEHFAILLRRAPGLDLHALIRALDVLIANALTWGHIVSRDVMRMLTLVKPTATEATFSEHELQRHKKWLRNRWIGLSISDIAAAEHGDEAITEVWSHLHTLIKSRWSRAE